MFRFTAGRPWKQQPQDSNQEYVQIYCGTPGSRNHKIQVSGLASAHWPTTHPKNRSNQLNRNRRLQSKGLFPEFVSRRKKQILSKKWWSNNHKLNFNKTLLPYCESKRVSPYTVLSTWITELLQVSSTEITHCIQVDLLVSVTFMNHCY